MALFPYFALINVVLLIISIGFTIYGFILFVKVTKRGIKALDIYIEKNSEDKIG
ncbi:MAG: hypothetical protein N4A57_12045 [Anaeromicrobium sp.]|jgi:hypothetical protein|uniref:hypothetical protein n=1 Tax=Anaeromicrobium sp. TaxID=1929132 RepID=UPI0025DF7A9A|nr:hypothetical protein [Anaeromicrobium sp.]MCT4594984.1 hypothetical protein [Anaeromicrobium sp.]